jgi:hypothetical protein
LKDIILFSLFHHPPAINTADRLKIDSITMSSPKVITEKGREDVIETVDEMLEYIEKTFAEFNYEECVEKLRKFIDLDEVDIKFICRKAQVLGKIRRQGKVITLVQKR